ncbi:purine nucleoside permease [Pontibacter silvestris]|uniref:Purine nucleoside permease n=1 Tax=Pontibacter silvestris TaxID=2305183 RepID=A0ABW4WYY4_9BACT|nr:purine nucleoside permease [Pontibacter silvestris]MCC9135650.1 purine nucleoside permease [Pontibacter silvestris]
MRKFLCVLIFGTALISTFCQSPGSETANSSTALSETAVESSDKIPVKVVIVTAFENGKDTGDRPGEYQYWVERLPLPDSIPFPQGYRTLRYNPEKQVLAICTGMGTARSAASIMALGMDPRFDLSQAYWMVTAISGIDPEDGTIGSAVWAEWLVDGDLAHEIDPRETPEDWTTGYIPLGKSKPYEEPTRENDYNNAMHLNPALVDWAYTITKDVKLDDDEKIRNMRAKYTNYPEAQKPPRVMKGDHVAAMTYWHGKYNNDWANAWVKYWTHGQGNFVTSAMEDTGTGQALEFLAQAGKVDFNRYLVLRTASNFTMQHSYNTATESLSNKEIGYVAYIPSLEAAYKIGVVVVDSLINNWETYKDRTPGN